MLTKKKPHPSGLITASQVQAVQNCCEIFYKRTCSLNSCMNCMELVVSGTGQGTSKPITVTSVLKAVYIRTELRRLLHWNWKLHICDNNFATQYIFWKLNSHCLRRGTPPVLLPSEQVIRNIWLHSTNKSSQFLNGQTWDIFTHGSRDKGSPFCRRHLKFIFLYRHCCMLIEISLKFVWIDAIHNELALLRIVAWRAEQGTMIA